MNISTKIRSISSMPSAYKSNTRPGIFGIPRKMGNSEVRPGSETIAWYGCRESFHHFVDPAKTNQYFFFHGSECKITDVADFIYKIEKILDLEDIDKTVFYPTEYDANNENICWIVVSPFWMKQDMRHSLFTIFLRASFFYRKEQHNFYQSIYTNKYVVPTIHAVLRFLDGYTWFTPPKEENTKGWYKHFSGELRKGVPLVGDLLQPHLSIEPSVPQEIAISPSIAC